MKRILATARPARGAAAVLVLVAVALAAPACTKSRVNASWFGNVAIKGYDPVACFTDGRPVPGVPEFHATRGGATRRFATAVHRDLFVADPERYAPQYGGYCACAVAQGTTADIDPAAWTIVDGKLYLNRSLEV